MAQVEILKPQTNIPIRGTLKGAWFAKSRNPEYSDQVKFRVDVEELGLRDIYLNQGVITDAIRNGVIAENGTDKDGNPGFKVVAKTPVTIWRKEEGTKRFTEVFCEEAVPPRAAPSAPVKRTEAGPGKPAAPAPVSADRFAQLVADYRACVGAANDILTRDYASSDTIVAAAATLFIQMQREGIHVPVKLTAASFAGMPEALTDDDLDDLGF